MPGGTCILKLLVSCLSCILELQRLKFVLFISAGSTLVNSFAYPSKAVPMHFGGWRGALMQRSDSTQTCPTICMQANDDIPLISLVMN